MLKGGLLGEKGVELGDALLDPKAEGEGGVPTFEMLEGTVMLAGTRGLLKKLDGAAFGAKVADGVLVASCVGFVSKMVTGAIEGLKEGNPPLASEGLKKLLVDMTGFVSWDERADT